MEWWQSHPCRMARVDSTMLLADMSLLPRLVQSGSRATPCGAVSHHAASLAGQVAHR